MVRLVLAVSNEVTQSPQRREEGLGRVTGARETVKTVLAAQREAVAEHAQQDASPKRPSRGDDVHRSFYGPPRTVP